MPRRALILVDLQPDFMPGGALAVPGGDEVLGPALALVDHLASDPDALIVATQDWHPPDHTSFAANHLGRKPGDVVEIDGLDQVLWPVHCVQGSPGAALAPALQARLGSIAAVFQKGTNPRIDSYSGFFDNGRRSSTGLSEWLRARGVESVVVLGLATDYGVRFTVLDALEQGFATTVVRDGCRAINLEPGDDAAAFVEMVAAGAEVVDSADILGPPGTAPL